MTRNILAIPFLLAGFSFWFCPIGTVGASGSLDSWRDDVAATRQLAENDVPRAYKIAWRLQTALPEKATPTDRVRLLNLLARIELYAAETELAAQHIQQARDIAGRHNDRVGQIEADLIQAANAVNEARIDDMIEAVNHAMTILDGIDRPDLMSEAMLRAAVMYLRLGQIDDAVNMALRTMEVAKHSGTPLALMYAHHGMAIILEQNGSHAEARHHYEQMLEQARLANTKMWQPYALMGLGRLAATSGDAAGGERLIQEAIQLCRSVGTPFCLGQGLYLLGSSLQGQGRHAEALLLFDEAIAIYEPRANKIALWWTLDARSASHQAMGSLDAAMQDAGNAQKLAKQIGLTHYLSESAQRMAAIAAARGEYQKAYELSLEAVSVKAKAEREKSSERIAKLAQRYESESKQRQIQELTRRNEQQAVQQRWLWTVLGSSFILLASTAFFLLRLRRSNRVLEALNTQVQRSQNKVQAILDAIPDPLFVLGLDGRYHEYYSPRSDLLAAPPDHLLGKTIFDILPPEVAEVGLSAIREAREKGFSSGKQYELSLPQGSFWFELSVARKVVAKGNEPMFVVLSRDITVRKRMEEALRQREQEFRSLAESSPDSIIRYDLEQRILYLNGGLVNYLGLASADEVIGRRPIEVWPDGRYAMIEEANAHAIETGSATNVEIIEPVEGGSPRYHHITVVPERDAAGTIIGTIAFGREVTAIREAERKLHTLVENIPDFIARFDRECRHLYVNPAIVRAFGAPAEHFVGKTVSELEPVERRPQYTYLENAIRQAFAEGKINHTEARWMLPAGERIFEIQHVPEKDENGNVVSVIGIARDITERKAHMRELQRWRDIFEHAEWGVVVGSVDGMTLELMNPAFARMHGYTVEELTGSPIAEVFAPQSREDFPEQIRKAHEKGHHSFESWHVRKDGTIFPVFIDVTTVRGEDGQILHRIVNVQDITERKQQQVQEKMRLRIFERLAKGGELPEILGLVASYVEQARPDFLVSIMLTDEAGKHLHATAAPSLPAEFSAAINGIAVGEGCGSCGTAVWRGETVIVEDVRMHPFWAAYQQLAVQAGLLACWSEPIIGSTGEVLGAFGIYRREPGGPSTAELGIVRHASHLAAVAVERRNMEAALRKSEQEFRALAENSPDYISRYDAECRRVYVNPTMAALFGLPEEEILGKTPMDLSPIPASQHFMDLFREVWRNRHEAEWEFPFRTKQGDMRWGHMRIVPEFRSGGDVASVLAIGRDITALKEAEQRLEESQAELRELATRREAAREEERRNISRELHDELGQLLTAIRMEISVLKLQYEPDDTQFQDKMQRIVALVDRTIRGVRDVVVMLRPAVLERGIVAALEWLTDEFKVQTGIACELHISEEQIVLDEERSIAIFRIVQESLTNVARHSGADMVNILLERNGNGFHIKISDNGKGFDPTMQKKKSLGLIGVRERVIRLDGEVKIDSTPGRGTTLEIHLPQ